MKIKLGKIISIILVIGWMAVIFSFSAQEASQSSRQSEGFIEAAGRFIEKVFGTEYKMDKETFFNVESFVRKGAHFFSYMVLGVLVRNCFGKFKVSKKNIVSLAVCLIYAASDEIHQLFVPGRSGQVSDVLLDFAGSITGVLLFIMACRIIGSRRKI